MANRTVKVVDHQSENRVNFLLGISSVMREGGILLQVSDSSQIIVRACSPMGHDRE